MPTESRGLFRVQVFLIPARPVDGAGCVERKGDTLQSEEK